MTRALPRWKQMLLRVSAGAVFFVAFVGFLHTSYGRPILRMLPGAKCPLGLDKQTTHEEREAARVAALKAVLGVEKPAARPALGFQLGVARRADVLAWAARFDVACGPSMQGDALTCPKVSANATPDGREASDVVFVFDPSERLVAVNAARRGLSPSEAARFVLSRAASLTRDVGPATRIVGDADAKFLAPGAVSSAAYEFAFSDYRAVVSATQMGQLGLLVREQYQAVAD